MKLFLIIVTIFIYTIKINAQAPSFNNTAAGAGNQIMFNTCKANTPSPQFAITPATAANRIMIELNTNSGFTGTAYTQTFSGAYTSGTKYDLFCTSITLPQGTYFCRARTSNNAGSTWTAYSTALWVYTYSSVAPWGHHHTAKEQFDSPNSTTVTPSPLYGNFITTNNNATANNASDDYFLLDEGDSDNLLVSASDQALTEGTSHYSGGSNNCITVGYYTASGSVQDYHGFRFQAAKIPQGAAILTASFSCYAHTGSGCGGSANTTNQMLMRIRGENVDDCAAWASGTNVTTGSPRYRNRTTAFTDWNVPSGASQQWSTGLLLNAPSVTSIVQEIVNRAGYAASNDMGIIVDHNGSAGAYWRYFATMTANTAYKARLQTTFNNFRNELTSPTFNLNSVLGATSWDQLYFTNDLTGCGTCAITYSVYTSGNVLIASGSSSPFSLGGNTAASVYVKAQIFRSNTGTFTPKGLDFTLTTNTTILPVEMLNFDAMCSDNQVLLNWCTASEKNNAYFTIEQSVNGIDFYTLDNIKGNGTINSKSCYNYKTTPLSNDINYYRLVQTDHTSKTHASKIISVKGCESGKPGIIITNTGAKTLNLLVNSTANQILTLKVIDLLGQLVTEKELQIPEGNNTLTVDLSSVANGMYNVVILKDEQLFINKKVILSDN